jgi:hypothetical protein
MHLAAPTGEEDIIYCAPSTVGISAQGTETELGQDKGKLMPLIVICEHPSPIAKVFLVGL